MLFPNYFGEALLCNCSGTLGVGFYGNEEMKKGDNSMYTAASDTKDIVNDISTQVCFCEQIYLWQSNIFVILSAGLLVFFIVCWLI